MSNSNTRKGRTDRGRLQPGSESQKLLSRRVHPDFTAITGESERSARPGETAEFTQTVPPHNPPGRRVQLETSGGSTLSGDRNREPDPYAPVCAYCGLPIGRAGETCSALEDGRCRP